MDRLQAYTTDYFHKQPPPLRKYLPNTRSVEEIIIAVTVNNEKFITHVAK